MDKNYNNDYEVRLATLAKLGGDISKTYQNIYEVDLAILEASGKGGGGGIEPVIVDELPEVGEEGKMYFVPSSDPGVDDNYKEYLWINDNWECVGNAAVDMSEYAKVVNLTQDEYDALEVKDDKTFYNITDATPFVIDDYYTKEEINTQAANYNPKNTTTSASGYNFPRWNSYGQITGTYATAYQASQSINGSSRTLYSTSSSSLTSFYAPTTAGTAGQVLLSSGSGAPVWTDYKSDATAYISEADIKAGTYSDEIKTFYNDCISNQHIMPVQIFSETEHEVLSPGDALSAVPDVDGKFVVQNETEVVITHEDETTTTINADGTITGSGVTLSEDKISGYNVYVVVTAGTLTSGNIFSETMNTYTAYSYYMPSSSRLFVTNVELWLLTTSDAKTWTKEYILITDDSVTYTSTPMSETTETTETTDTTSAE